MFRYIVDPFTGRASFDGFSIARQAGTTLALCELGAAKAARRRRRSRAAHRPRVAGRRAQGQGEGERPLIPSGWKHGRG
ncbi:hypothetical protein ACMHYB_37870 [Sorangium sp. So ce1128]